MGEARVQAAELWCSFWGQSLQGCCGRGALTCPGVMPPLLQRFLPFSRWFPARAGAPQSLQSVRTGKHAAFPIQTSFRLPTLPPRLDQPRTSLHPAPRLGPGVPASPHRSCRLFVVLHPFPHPTRLHVGQGRVCVISLFQDRALDLASSMKRHPACG